MFFQTRGGGRKDGFYGGLHNISYLNKRGAIALFSSGKDVLYENARDKLTGTFIEKTGNPDRHGIRIPFVPPASSSVARGFYRISFNHPSIKIVS
jgi:hypothetical protein